MLDDARAVVVAVSGGADSVALLDMLVRVASDDCASGFTSLTSITCCAETTRLLTPSSSARWERA